MEERLRATPDHEVQKAMRQALAELMVTQAILTEQNQFDLSEEELRERDALFAEVLHAELTQARGDLEAGQPITAPEQPDPEDRKPHTSLQTGFDKLED